MTVAELKKNPNYYRHHVASRRGYESRKENLDGTYGHVERYEGKFGKGFIHIAPRWDTTMYVYVIYYIERGE